MKFLALYCDKLLLILFRHFFVFCHLISPRVWTDPAFNLNDSPKKICKKKKRGRLMEKKTEIQTIDWSLIDCDHGASLCSRKLVLLLFLCLFSFIWDPHPFLSLCLYVCHPHPIPTLSQVSTSFPQPCTVTMVTSGLWRHSAAVAQCLCPYSLCSLSFSHSLCLSFFLSLCFVWLVMSGLSNYVSIFNVVLIVLFFFVSFWFVHFSDVTFPLI